VLSLRILYNSIRVKEGKEAFLFKFCLYFASRERESRTSYA